MKFVQLGKSNMKISKIGFGSRNILQRFKNDNKSLEKLISGSIDLGINFFIAASHYSDGKTEKLIGNILSEYRNEIVLATSVGVAKAYGKIILDLSPESLKKQIYGALKNLRTDSLDLLQLHYANPLTNNRKTLDYLLELKSSGIIKSIGLSNHNLDQLREWTVITDSVQMPYNPIQREIEKDYLDYCNKHVITVLAYTPLLAGLYTSETLKGTNDPEIVHYFPDKKDALIKSVQVLSEAAKQINKTVPEVVLAWMSQISKIDSILVGTTNIEHLKSNVSAIEMKISQKEIEIIQEAFRNVQLLFPKGITYPLFIENIRTHKNGEKFTNAMGFWFKIPSDVKIGDTVIINDTLGDVVSVLPR